MPKLFRFLDTDVTPPREGVKILGAEDVPAGGIILRVIDETYVITTIEFLADAGIEITEEIVGTDLTITIGATGYRRLEVRGLISSNVTKSGTLTHDGVAYAGGDPAWLINQTSALEDGPWLVQGGAWTRPSGYVAPGTEIRISEGTIWAGTIWRVTNATEPTLGTNAVLSERVDQKLVILPGTNANINIPENLGPRSMYILPVLSALRTWTLPAAPMRGQEILFQYNATGTSQLVLARSGTQNINGGTANVGIPVSSYRRGSIIFDGANWFLNSSTGP
jgi:hypothetical protein